MIEKIWSFMKKAIIIGASSGIGYELSKVLSEEGYEVGLLARRVELLSHLQKELSTKTFVNHIDLNHISEAMSSLNLMIREINGVDLIIFSSGVGFLNPELDWQKEKQTIDVNVNGFCALINQAYKYFVEKGHGHIVAISSIGALRGNHVAPAYNASKAFMSNYLEGLRKKAKREGRQIFVTDIQPGAVDTAMLKGEGHFWIASPSKAAKQIYIAIQKKKPLTYVTKRWRLIAWLLKLMPQKLYEKM